MSCGEQDGQNDQLCVPAQILQEEKPLGRKMEDPERVLPELWVHYADCFVSGLQIFLVQKFGGNL